MLNMGESKKDAALAAITAAAGGFADKVRPVVVTLLAGFKAQTDAYRSIGTTLYEYALERGDWDFVRKVFRAAVASVVQGEGESTEKGTDGARIVDAITRAAIRVANQLAGMLDADGRVTQEPNPEAAKAGFKPTQKPKGTEGSGGSEPQKDPMDDPLAENVTHAAAFLSITLLQLQSISDPTTLSVDDVVALTKLDSQVGRLLAWLRKDPTGKAIGESITARHEYEKGQAA
jgi:hypothetical protein